MDVSPRPSGLQSSIASSRQTRAEQSMKDFFCYIHTPGCLTPELRVVSGELKTLHDILIVEMRQWPEFEVLDVYDAADHQILRIGAHGGASFRH
jgi:hypothetical protein